MKLLPPVAILLVLTAASAAGADRAADIPELYKPNWPNPADYIPSQDIGSNSFLILAHPDGSVSRQNIALLDGGWAGGIGHILDTLGRMSAYRTDLRYAIVQFYPPFAGASERLLEGGRQVSTPGTFIGSLRELPGGVVGAAAVERLLGAALTDTAEVPLEFRYDELTYTRPRVGDMAALVMSLRWPGKYLFRWSVDVGDRDRQIAIINAEWKKP